MNRAQANLSPIAIASFAFLLNWVVFVDPSPLARLAPFALAALNLDNSSLGLVPVSQAPAFQTRVSKASTVAFETPNYRVRITDRTGKPHLSIYPGQSATPLISVAAEVVHLDGHRRYQYIPPGSAPNEPAVWVTQLTEAQWQLTVEQAGQVHTETGR
ncbi:MAG: hypothetical protein AAFR42_09460 [Cyanobacteria bacterium J06628_6]